MSLTTPYTGNHERKQSLDFLRGLAILGMLIANVPWHVGNSMSRVIDPDISSSIFWLLQYLVFDQRFMPIFCFLFGAGYTILSEYSASFQSFRIYYLKRMLILLGIGVLHAYLLWPGDILITYAVCGPLLLLFHKSSTRKLVIWGCSFVLLDMLFGEWPKLYSSTLDAVLFSWWVDYGEAPMSAAQAYAGSYSDLFSYNAWRNQFLQWTALPYFRVWNALGLMLLGIALYRTGFLQGNSARQTYIRALKITIAVGIPLVVYGVIARIGINLTIGEYFGFTHTLPLYTLTFRIGCTLSSIAIIAAVHLLWPRISNAVRSLVASVGKMALSNYLLQSVFFVLLMHTLGLFAFDTLDHDVMFMLVVILWAIHLVFSYFWLSIFRKGPIESVYRYILKRI